MNDQGEWACLPYQKQLLNREEGLEEVDHRAPKQKLLQAGT